MAKQLAHKRSRILKTEAQIRDERLNIGEFSGNWQGRIAIIQPTKSKIADQMDFHEKGEYAIKVR